MKLAFNSTIQLRKLQTRIMRKVRGSTWGKISKLQCNFFASVDLYRYELSNVTGEVHLETIISSHCSSENDVIELYIKFAEANGFGLSLTTIAMNKGTEAEVKILLHSCTEPMRVYSTPCSKVTMKVQMRKKMQPMKNLLAEGKDLGEEEKAVDVVDNEELDLGPIQQRGPNGSEVILFSELEAIPIESKPCESEYDPSDNSPNPNIWFRAYKPLPYMTNIDLLVRVV
ncbi:hypothetical protein PVK06_027519 [Gossypium arboreum]|uniref:Uncharacterized protein n=1 Tax=Gossypium arboreum TaxID=29729 RepID=A0ABR0P0K3_GOSAR|nr:hypothetical protein PVK06_027519 [Gossypium arboreum]